jgi:hypothetical protein
LKSSDRWHLWHLPSHGEKHSGRSHKVGLAKADEVWSVRRVALLPGN